MIKKFSLALFILISMLLLQTACFADYYGRELTEAEMQQAETLYKAGVAYARAQAYDKAIDSFKQAVSINPEMTDAYYNIASIYINQKKYDDAYSVYT
ncbi:tetratricopeptide repeat protein, partial [bacterium]|nr:tetratricopeptide repeat protein [bacterium]